MHISEGVLSPPVLAAGYVLAAAGVYAGLKRLPTENLAKVGILAAAFYVASLIHIKIGPASVHLIMNGLLGLLLGWASVPAIMVGLLLQAIMFGHGGLTVLGVNTVIMALPAVASHHAFAPLVRQGGARGQMAAFAAGSLAVALGAILVGATLIFTGEAFTEVAWTAMAAHVPVMIAEGFITLFAVNFLSRVKPEMLHGLTTPG